MEHYFLAKEHNKSEYFDFSDNLLNNNLTFTSVPGVFNYHGVDKGTKALIDSIAKCNIDLKGDVLDIGCGLGIIGIALAKKYSINLTMADVNSTAVNLAIKNCKTNKVTAKVLLSDKYSAINGTYNYIVSNPPIKAGKATLFDMVLGAYDYLRPNGSIIIVIRKDLGMNSLKTAMIDKFGNVQILNRDKGYYILMSTKK